MRESSILISWSFLCPNGTIFNQESIQTNTHLNLLTYSPKPTCTVNTKGYLYYICL